MAESMRVLDRFIQPSCVRFFELAPSGQDYFKQSLARLDYIADQPLAQKVSTWDRISIPTRETCEVSFPPAAYSLQKLERSGP